jgi:hypothetical protein
MMIFICSRRWWRAIRLWKMGDRVRDRGRLMGGLLGNRVVSRILWRRERFRRRWVSEIYFCSTGSTIMYKYFNDITDRLRLVSACNARNDIFAKTAGQCHNSLIGIFWDQALYNILNNISSSTSGISYGWSGFGRENTFFTWVQWSVDFMFYVTCWAPLPTTRISIYCVIFGTFSSNLCAAETNLSVFFSIFFPLCSARSRVENKDRPILEAILNISYI